jgi:hypothetical protein
MKSAVLLVFVLILRARSSFAGDIYLFQAHSDGPLVYNSADKESQFIEWSTDAFFFNRGAGEAQVKLLDEFDGMAFTIPPHRSVSLSNVLPHVVFTFVHASVPDLVIVENALFIGEVPDTTSPIGPDYKFGKVRLPVFSALSPANQPQVHLATFLGSQPTRHNVWIYNGGDARATAHIEIHRQCDDAIVDETSVTMEAKTSLVVSGLGSEFHGCPITVPVQVWTPFSTYTIVTVDQPSLSFVSSLANNEIPKANVSVN